MQPPYKRDGNNLYELMKKSRDIKKFISLKLVNKYINCLSII